MWPQMWPTCSGSKQPRQQLAATEELGGAWLWPPSFHLHSGAGQGLSLCREAQEQTQLCHLPSASPSRGGAEAHRGKQDPVLPDPTAHLPRPAQPGTEGSDRRGTGDRVAQHEVGKGGLRPEKAMSGGLESFATGSGQSR